MMDKDIERKTHIQQEIKDGRLTEVFFKCIQDLETARSGESKCLNDILTCPEVYKSRYQIAISPGCYTGENPELRVWVEETKTNKHTTISLFDAVVLFFLNNPYAAPERDFCEYRAPSGDTELHKVNCLSHVFDLALSYGGSDGYGGNTAVHDLSATDSVIGIINRGARCALGNPSAGGSKLTPAMHEIGSCLEALLDHEMRTYVKGVHSHTKFQSVIDKYDWSIPGFAGIPGIQLLLDGGDLKTGRESTTNFLLSLPQMGTQSGLEAVHKFNDVLSREYDFKVVDFPRTGGKKDLWQKYKERSVPLRATAIEYALETGSSVAPVLGLLSTGYELSTSHVAKFLSKLPCWNELSPGGKTQYCYSLVDRHTLERSDLMHIFDFKGFDNVVVDGDCSFQNQTCVDFMIDNAGSGVLIGKVLKNVLTSIPPTDLLCTLYSGESAGTSRTTNCLDKIMSLDGTYLKDEVIKSGILLDRDDCTDADGNRITCIDKLAQQHEVWLYLKSVQHNAVIKPDAAGIEAYMKNLGVFNANVSWNWVAGQYDIGNEKMHPPGKEYAALQPIIEDDFKKTEKYDEKHPLTPTPNRKAYLAELRKSVTSPTPQREVQILPRLVKLYDANRMNKGFTDRGNFIQDVGLYEVYNTEARRIPASLSMHECADGFSGKTISCMQKIIDIAKDSFDNTKFNSSADVRQKLFNVYAMRDIMQPICQIAGEKSSCLEYAINMLGGSGSGDEYKSLLARRDFRSIMKMPAAGAAGKAGKTLGDEVCSKVKFRDFADYLFETRPHDPGDNPTKDGDALELYSVCKCNTTTTPLGRRICADKVCYDGFTGYRGHAHDPNMWYEGYVKNPELMMRHYRYNGQDDAFGIAGVYDVTYSPSQYSEVGTATGGQATKTSVFNYKKTVEKFILPALPRAIGHKMSKYDKYTNVKIVDVLAPPPTEEGGDFIVTVRLEGTDKDGTKREFSTEPMPMSEAFTKKGLLGRSDVKARIVKYQDVATAIDQIVTRKASVKTDATFKLVISNRPADFIRASNCQNWWSCMSFQDPGTNPAQMGHMGLGGYVAYLASDELALKWYVRANMDPGMDLPGKPNNAFEIYKMYGMTPYKQLTGDAIKMVLYEAGYNHPQKIAETHDRYGGRMIQNHTPREYIYNSRFGGWGTKWRGSGYGSGYPSVYSGTRVEMVKNEIREEITRKCIEKIIAGESVLAKATGVFDSVVINDEDACDALGKSLDTTPTQTGFTPSKAEKMGLLGKDLVVNWNNFRDISDYHDEGGGTPWEITDTIYNTIKNGGMRVTKVSSLTTAGTNQW